MPGGGMPGPSGDENGNASALPAPPCPRHCGHYGGEKLSPPTVVVQRQALEEGHAREEISTRIKPQGGTRAHENHKKTLKIGVYYIDGYVEK